MISLELFSKKAFKDPVFQPVHSPWRYTTFHAMFYINYK